MQEKVMKLIKDSNISFPKLLLNQYKNLNMTELDLVYIIYFMNLKDLEFNPNQIGKDLNYSLPEVMLEFDRLNSSGFIKLDIKKEFNIRKEIINLDPIYDKLLYLIIKEENTSKPTDIFTIFETEFGRTLAPMEYEIINSWMESGYEKELIISALKEAVYNGVFKLNYIDKILYEWGKKGIKTSNDVAKDKTDYNKKKEEKKELYDYNWLEDE
jgi:DNA replication protein